MARKFLDDLNTEGTWNMFEPGKDKREEQWSKEKEIYGFDSRDTWNLDSTMIELLYERLKLYKEVTIVELKARDHTINNVTKNAEEWVDKLLELCEEYITTDHFVKETNDSEIWGIWAVISSSIWW